MEEMLTNEGLMGAIFDGTVLIKVSFEGFRHKNIVGKILAMADTGEAVLDANVSTACLVLSKQKYNHGTFIKLDDTKEKESILQSILCEKDHPNRIYIKDSHDFKDLPNAIIKYDFGDDLVEYFNKYENLDNCSLSAHQGHSFVPPERYFRLNYEIINPDSYYHLYHGGAYNMFYYPYKDLTKWDKNGEIVKHSKSVLRNLGFQGFSGCGYGKRGEILDAHILKNRMIFTHEGHAISKITTDNGIIVNSFINSILCQYVINQYCTQHKVNGYINLLPLPFDAAKKNFDDIKSILTSIINIRRRWFSIDETNLEYQGLIAKLNICDTVQSAIDELQSLLLSEFNCYQNLIEQNDNIWMEMADIKEDSELRKTLIDYKHRRPYEELISIDNASSKNILDTKILAQEIIMELVGLAFGRWDVEYRQNPDNIPAFGDIFDALPFMPTVSLSEYRDGYPINYPTDGILSGDDSGDSLVRKVRESMVAIWGEKADDIEYELCNIIGYTDLFEYLSSPSGFFAYHFTRYTKSRRKAPIYWPLTSERGKVTLWVYYPRMNGNTLAALVLRLSHSLESYKSDLSNASLRHDRAAENEARVMIEEHEGMIEKLRSLIAQNYVPNHDDGVPVTAAPLAALFGHSAWRNECQSNLELLQEGEYDWSHLAYSMFPNRIREKVKKDWCLALTHSLEELCDNKPKPKKERKAKKVEDNSLF
jgi:hypothetical protein